MKTYSTTKRFPILAGMQFGTSNNKIKTVGYKWVKFIYDTKERDYLINEIEVKRAFI